MTLETCTMSTHEVVADFREEFVRDYYGRIAMKMDVQFESAASIAVRSKSFFLPGASVTEGVVSTLTATRTKELRNDANSDVVLMFALDGIVFGEKGNGIYIPPGDAILSSLDRQISFHTLCESSRQVTLKFRREALAPLVSHLDDRLAGHLSLKAPGAALLLRYALGMFRAQDASRRLGDTMSRHVAELAALAIGADRAGERIILDGGVKAARLAAAKNHVMQNLADPALDAAGVAAQIGVSIRYLHMLFDTEDYSFNEFILSQRLARASRLLGDPAARHFKIADIAARTGFSDISSFNRAFRRKFGMRPSDCRSGQRPDRDS